MDLNRLKDTVGSAMSAGFDKARDFTNSLRSGPVQTAGAPGVGEATTQALGDASVKWQPAGGAVEIDPAMTAARQVKQASAAATANAESAALSGADAATKEAAGLRMAPPQPEFTPPPQAANGVNPPGRSFDPVMREAERRGIGYDAMAGKSVPPEGAGAPPLRNAPAAPAKAGGLASKAGTAMKWAGRAATVLAAADAADKAASGQTLEQKTHQAGGVMGGLREFQDNMLGGYGRQLSDATLEGVGGLVKGSPTGEAGIMPRLRAGATAFGNEWNRVGALKEKYSGGAMAATTPPAQTGSGTPAPQGPTSGVISGPTAGQPSGVKLRGGGVQAPQDLINGTGVPAPGYGAFKRSGGEAVSLHAPASVADALASYRHAGINPFDNTGGDKYGELLRSEKGLRDPENIQGATGLPPGFGGTMNGSALGKLAAARETRLGELQDRAYGLKRAQYGMQRRAADDTHNTSEQALDINREKQHSDRVKAQVESDIPQADDGLMKNGIANRKAQVDQRHAHIMDQIKATVADRKTGAKTVGGLSPAEMDSMLIAHKIKEKTTDARGNLTQSIRDALGTKRFDTKNLDSWLPDHVERSNTPGSSYKVIMKNGNTVDVKEAGGGHFNVLSPNEPVNKDIMDLIQPHIDAFRKAQGNK